MSDSIEKLSSLPSFFSLAVVSDEQIRYAEQILALQFADDYREYLRKYGVASAAGHELTGLCDSRRLNVVDATLSEKNANPDIPHDWYVLEETNIDGIVIWQNSSGEIFQGQPNTAAIKLCDSLCAYFELKL